MVSNSQTAVFISGMHRSGTSLTARLLNIWGVHISSNLLDADRNNQSGYWESRELNDLNEELLVKANSSWDDPSLIHRKKLIQLVHTDVGERAKEFLTSELQSKQAVLFKDPRLGRLLPFWLAVCEAVDVKPFIVLPYRHPDEVANSLHRRDKLPLDGGYLLYVINNLSAAIALQSVQHICLDFNVLLEEQSTAFQSLHQKLPNIDLKENVELTSQFINKKLQHNKQSNEYTKYPIGELAHDVFLMLQTGQFEQANLKALKIRLQQTEALSLELTQWYSSKLLGVVQQQKQEIDQLRQDDIDSHKRNELIKFLQKINFYAHSRELVIWGAGSGGIQTLTLLNYLGHQVSHFVDSDPNKCGKLIKQIEIKDTNTLSENANDDKPYVIVGSMFYDEISNNLIKMGFRETHDFCANSLFHFEDSVLKKLANVDTFEAVKNSNETDMEIDNLDHDYRYYEKQQDFTDRIDNDIKVLSYYLPQFHTTPENDEWHGEGFTEWTNTKKASPLFQGHYQPHAPHPDLGYYTLETSDAFYTQLELMKKSGVHGQIFYHYWFDGRLILEKPAKLLLANAEIDMPFCFCWANENWTRAWDGDERDILIEQKYSDDDANEFIKYLIPFFKDKRYISIDERPVIFIYRLASIPNFEEYKKRWALECTNAGLKEPYIVATLTRDTYDPRDHDVDAGVERVLHDWTKNEVSPIHNQLRFNNSFNGSVLSYDEVARHYSTSEHTSDYTYFRSIVPIWDNTARHDSKAYLVHGSNPYQFQKWLESLVSSTQKNLPNDKQFIIVNAWNEWAEGAHLEPDEMFGYSYLNSVGRALSHTPFADPVSNEQVKVSNVHITVSDSMADILGSHETYLDHLIAQLNDLSINHSYQISTNSQILSKLSSSIELSPTSDSQLMIHLNQPVVMNGTALHSLLQTAATHPDMRVVPQLVNSEQSLPQLTEHAHIPIESYDEVSLECVYQASEELYPFFKVETQAHAYLYAHSETKSQLLKKVSTVIRFHSGADFDKLATALYCLGSMSGVIVTPIICCQNLTLDEQSQLSDLLESIRLIPSERIEIIHFRADAHQDLRTQMLNDGLKRVTTRYATFLDYDDRLFSHAYEWLVDRLEESAFAVSAARVYETSSKHSTGVMTTRRRSFEFGSNFYDFIAKNFLPIHSFMLDLSKLTVEHIEYDEDMKFMEDYYLTLQVFNRTNTDWQGLAKNVYIGDYVHSSEDQTLAFTDHSQRTALIEQPDYQYCESKIKALKKKYGYL